MEIITRERFLTNDDQHYHIPEGLTIDEILASIGWSQELRPWTMVTIGGHEIAPAYWSRTRPREGNNIMVAIRPSGGGGGSQGKQIGMAVAAIAISIVAIYAAPIIVGSFLSASAMAAATAAGGVAIAYPVTTALVAAGIAMAGNLALGAFVKPGKLGPAMLGNSGSGGNTAAESSTYDIKGSSNALNRYGVVPRVYGRHRITPPLAAEPYVVSSGTSQTMHLLLDFGYGPLMVEDIRIGNTPITEFKTARWNIHPYYTSGAPLYIYLNDQATADVSAILVQGQDNIRAVPQAASTIVLEFQFPAGLVEYNDQGASFQRNEHITIFAAPNSAPTAWQPISDYYPYALFDGEGGTNTAGQVQVYSFSTYIWNRDPPGFTTADRGAAALLPVGSFFNFLGQNYTIQGITDPAPNNSDQVLVRLDRNPPNVNFIWTNTGVIQGQEGAVGTVTTYAGGGTYGPLTVTFGPSLYDVEFHGQTRSPRTVSVVLQMPYEDMWRILVRRSTPVSNSSLVANAITWGTIRAGRWAAPIYPKSMRTIMELAVTATEQVTGQLQSINALCTSILWDARAGIMTPSRNPALIYEDVLTGSANPRAVPWDRIDQTRILTWANNNEAVSAQGDMSNTFDIVVDFRATLADICQTICTAGRAAPTMRDGLYSVMEEETVKTPVQMFTNRNASGFTSNRTWVEFPHAIRAKYMSENTWNQEEMFVYRDGYDASNASLFETMEFPGITRPWQVWRAARYFIAAAMLRRERLTFNVDLENLVCQRGDMVKVAHDRLYNNITVRAREVNGPIITHDGIIEWAALTPPVNSSNHGQYLPANTGTPTGTPTGWLLPSWTAAGGTHSVIAKGVDAHGVEWCDIWIRSNTSTSSVAATIALRPGPSNPGDFIMFDDTFFHEQKASLHEGGDYAAGVVFTLQNQPLNTGGTTGLGTVNNMTLTMPTTGGPDLQRDTFFTSLRAGAPSTSNRGRAAYNQVQFRIQIVSAGSHYSFVLRLAGSKVTVLNRKPNLQDRVEAAGWNKTLNGTASGAIVGLLSGDGTVAGPGKLPDNWKYLNYTGWTRTVVATTVVWEYFDIDVRCQAAAGAASCIIDLSGLMSILPSRLMGCSVQVGQAAITGTAPTYRLGMRLYTDADALVTTLFGSNLTLTTTDPSRQAYAGTLTGQTTATKGRFIFEITPAAGAATDVTIRFRFPVAAEGSTADPITTTTVYPAETASGWYVDIRNSEGYLGWANQPIVTVLSADKIVLGNPSVYANIQPGDLMAIGLLDTETSEWLVESVNPGSDLSAQVRLIEHAPGIFVADSGSIPPYVPNNGNGVMTALPGIRNLLIVSTLYVYTPDGVPTHEVLLAWDPPGYTIREYLVYRTYVVTNPGASPSAPFINENVEVYIGSTGTPHFNDVLDSRTLRLNGTQVLYRVVPISETGRRGVSSSISSTFYPDTTPPPKVTFTTNVLSETTMLIWDRPNIPDLASYQIRFMDMEYNQVLGTNPTWERMTAISEYVSPVLTTLTVHSQTGVYAIRAVDTSGNFGEISYSMTKIGFMPNVNEVTRIVQGPTWTGTFDRTEIVGNELRLTKDPLGNYYAEGWFYSTTAVDYPAPWVFRVRGTLQSYALPLTPDPKGDWNVQIWVSIQRTAPKLNDPWFMPLSHAVPLAGGAGTYTPLGAVANTDLEGRLINWAIRLTSKKGTLTPSVSKATLIVDHSERREFGNDVATGTGGKNITFSRAFFATPTTAITLNDGQTGDRIVKSASTTALTVEVFTSAGVSVNRKIDWQAIGYGRGVT